MAQRAHILSYNAAVYDHYSLVPLPHRQAHTYRAHAHTNIRMDAHRHTHSDSGCVLYPAISFTTVSLIINSEIVDCNHFSPCRDRKSIRLVSDKLVWSLIRLKMLSYIFRQKLICQKTEKGYCSLYKNSHQIWFNLWKTFDRALRRWKEQCYETPFHLPSECLHHGNIVDFLTLLPLEWHFGILQILIKVDTVLRTYILNRKTESCMHLKTIVFEALKLIIVWKKLTKCQDKHI